MYDPLWPSYWRDAGSVAFFLPPLCWRVLWIHVRTSVPYLEKSRLAEILVKCPRPIRLLDFSNLNIFQTIWPMFLIFCMVVQNYKRNTVLMTLLNMYMLWNVTLGMNCADIWDACLQFFSSALAYFPDFWPVF